MACASAAQEAKTSFLQQPTAGHDLLGPLQKEVSSAALFVAAQAQLARNPQVSLKEMQAVHQKCVVGVQAIKAALHAYSPENVQEIQRELSHESSLVGEDFAQAAAALAVKMVGSEPYQPDVDVSVATTLAGAAAKNAGLVIRLASQASPANTEIGRIIYAAVKPLPKWRGVLKFMDAVNKEQGNAERVHQPQPQNPATNRNMSALDLWDDDSLPGMMMDEGWSLHFRSPSSRMSAVAPAIHPPELDPFVTFTTDTGWESLDVFVDDDWLEMVGAPEAAPQEDLTKVSTEQILQEVQYVERTITYSTGRLATVIKGSISAVTRFIEAQAQIAQNPLASVWDRQEAQRKCSAAHDAVLSVVSAYSQKKTTEVRDELSHEVEGNGHSPAQVVGAIAARALSLTQTQADLPVVKATVACAAAKVIVLAMNRAKELTPPSLHPLLARTIRKELDRVPGGRELLMLIAPRKSEDSTSPTAS